MPSLSRRQRFEETTTDHSAEAYIAFLENRCLLLDEFNECVKDMQVFILKWVGDHEWNNEAFAITNRANALLNKFQGFKRKES